MRMGMNGRIVQISQAKLEELKKSPSRVEQVMFPEVEGGSERALDLDYSWHALQYLLTGDHGPDGSPEGDSIMGGVGIGEDLGYGAATYLTPERVREVASALDRIPRRKLKKRFSLRSMNQADVYPGSWEDKRAIKDLLKYFDALKRYYKQASEKGNAMLLCVW
jgi:hypothetical protein